MKKNQIMPSNWWRSRDRGYSEGDFEFASQTERQCLDYHAPFTTGSLERCQEEWGDCSGLMDEECFESCENGDNGTDVSRRQGLEMQEVKASKNRMRAWVRDDFGEIKGGPCRECARSANCTADIQDRNECWSPPIDSGCWGREGEMRDDTKRMVGCVCGCGHEVVIPYLVDVAYGEHRCPVCDRHLVGPAEGITRHLKAVSWFGRV